MNFWTWLVQRAQPKPPVVTPVRTMAVGVWSGGQAITHATGVLDDYGHKLTAVNQGGRLVFSLGDLPYGWTRTIHVEADGFISRDEEKTLAPSVDVTLSPVIRRIVLPKLSIVGKFFRAGGERWTGIGCSDFALYARYLNGEDISPILAERQALGFNFLRVWLLNTSVYRIVPSDWGDRFYTALPAFCDLCAKFGLYVQFTALTQARTLMPDGAQQQAHLNRIDYELRDHTAAFGELGNELNNVDNPVWEGLSKPPYLLWSKGSMAGDPADNPPPRPAWDYENVHSFSLSGEWQRCVGKQAQETANDSGKPCMANENCRFPDNDNSTVHAFDAAAGGALLSAGSVFHSVSGKFSLPIGNAAPFAKAWCDGAKSVDLLAQDGAYVHRTDLERDGILRVYGSRLPDGREYDAVIRR